MEKFGAFVQFGNFRKNGLVHVSHIARSSGPKDRFEVEDIVSLNEQVWVKVTNIDDGKIGLSMKLVSQNDGTDLDPLNVEYEQQEARRRPMPKDQEKMTLTDKLNTICTKCGTKGHFAFDCTMSKGGTKYALVDDDEPAMHLPGAVVGKAPPPPPGAATNTNSVPLNEAAFLARFGSSEKKEKKAKKEKKPKKESAKKEKKRLKKEKRFMKKLAKEMKAEKKKKKKAASSSDDSSSSDSD